MAIPITDVAGLDAYLAAQGSVITDATTAEAAITAGKEIANLIELGDSSETKTVTEYTTVKGGDSQKAIGSRSFGNFQLDTLYDAADALGQSEMTSMWEDGTRKEIILKLSDDEGTSPSYVTFEVALSSQNMTFTKDGGIMYVSTAEQCSARNLIKAVV